VVASTAGLGAATEPQAAGHAVTMVYLFCWVPFGLAAVFMFRLSALPCRARRQRPLLRIEAPPFRGIRDRANLRRRQHPPDRARHPSTLSAG